MSTGDTNRRQKKSVHSLLRSISGFVGWAAPAAVIAGAFYFAAYEPAHSQMASKKHDAPFSSSVSSTLASETPKLAKAPVQVELPAPPPMRIFPGLEESLVATGPVTEEENRDLDAALKAFHEAPAKAGPQGDYADFAKPLLAFVEAHPKSNWNSALYLNLGMGYYRSGYYSRVFALLEKSWALGRNATSVPAQRMVDRAVGELAEMHARVGHADEIEALVKDIGKRPIGGPATELLQNALDALGIFRGNPDISFMCGPRALRDILTALHAKPTQIKVAEDAHSGPDGVFLAQLSQLADKAALKHVLIKREPGQPIPVPSVVHYKVHHYAGIVGTQDGKYSVEDTTFGNVGGSLLTSQAIDEESTGYFLVPESVMNANPEAGWRKVSRTSEEVKGIYGKGPWSNFSPNGPQCHLPKTGSKGTKAGMCVSSGIKPMMSLHLEDTPVGYDPQVGTKSQKTTINYDQRDELQPATIPFSNLSGKWTHSWMSYYQDNPTSTNHDMVRLDPSGAGNSIPSGATNGGTFSAYGREINDSSGIRRYPQPSNQPTVKYERLLADGSVETYDLNNGATTFPRYWFMTKFKDPMGNVTTYNYDTSFRLTSVVDPMGRSTTFTYGLTSYPLLITQITDGLGRAAQLTYDTSQRLASITDPVGITSSFTYSTTDPSFVTNLTTPYGTSTFSKANNPNDPPISGQPATRSLTMTDPLGYTDYVYFYGDTTLVPSSDPAASVPTGWSGANAALQWRNTYYWNKHQFALGATMSGGVVQSQDYSKAEMYHWLHEAGVLDLYGLLQTSKRPLENRVWYSYLNQTQPLNTGVFNTPTATGRVLDDGSTQKTAEGFNTGNILNAPYATTSVTDAAGRVTKINYTNTLFIDVSTVQQLTTSPSTYSTIATYGSYTAGHQPQTYTDAAGKVWSYTYNAAGQIKTVTDPASNVTTYNYDTTGRFSTMVDANSVTILTLTYDSADRILTRTDSQGYTLTYAYDNLDRITSITYPDATTDLYDYNFQSGPNVGTASLELRKYTDRLGRVTLRDYDANQRLIYVTEPIAGATTRTTSFDYYEDGTLKNLTDANGNVTHWEIDLQSRPVSKTYAYGTASAKTETYTYENTTSRLKSITDALGQVKTFAYGLDDRITGITYTNTVNTTPNVTFAYDTYFPRLTSMTDGTGTTNYSYTAIGTNGALKLSSIAGPYSNDTIGLTYDTVGRLSGKTITGGNETFGYDALYRLTSHATPLGTFTYGYLGETDQRTSRSVTNGSTTVSTSWGYDTNTNDRRLISIANSGITRSYTLGYGSSPVNPYDIMSITDTAASGHPFATQTHSYTYDNIDRLLTGNQTTPGNYTYAYDKLDNATTVTTPSGTVTPAPTYNVNNQLATWASSTYSYDANGNTLSGDGTKTYKWDAENRLIEIDYVGTSNKTVFNYDGFNHRRATADTVSGITITSRYMWCDDTLCQARDGSDNVLRRYLDEGEYNVSTSQKLVYMPDHIGSVRDALDATTGNRVASYDFSPYGTITQSNVTNGVDYQYARLFAHVQSGLQLSVTRPYDPVTGRWPSRDPIKEAGDLNLYSYVNANPMNFLDPEGLSRITICLKQKTVTMTDANGKVTYSSSVTPGCAATPSVPPGHYKAGGWQANKTNPKYWNTREPYSTNKYNGYGPWFLPVNTSNGNYTGTGIHGGPWQGRIPWLSCSHGCFRVGNDNITALHAALPHPVGTPIDVLGDCAN